RTTRGGARRTTGAEESRSSLAEDGTRRSGMRSCAPAASGAMAMTMRTAVASHLEGKDMFNCEDISCEDMGCEGMGWEGMGKIRMRAGSDISPRSRQMKGAARQPRAYGTNPAITPKLTRSFPSPPRPPRAAPPCRIDRRLVAGGCRGDDLCRRLRHRCHRDELRNAGVA